MIAKILRSGTASDIVGYVMREFHDKEKYTADTWRVIDSDGILGNDYHKIVESFDIGTSLNKRKSNPIGHISVSFDKSDLPRLTDDFMVLLAKEYMKKMSIIDTQYIIVRHLETDCPHFHIVYNRVNLHGKSIDERNNFKRSVEATKSIKKKYGLTFSPKKKQYEDVIAEMKPKIQAAMYRCKSWDEFQRRLAPTGISVQFYNDRDTGRPQGIRFSNGESTFNGSKIDRAFSYRRLDKFFAKNAGIRETQPQRPSPISITAKVKEASVTNVVENIIETGCQALGGLFQLGPTVDPEEEVFIRAMKKKSKKKKGRSI
ncbi:MAG: relaxase/mobilization nuclease domain-containing protein [Bacteroidales bacterium]|nr:relaxase/mobilization nuclease domain-containing protein [Bacteroidales bacterium]